MIIINQNAGCPLNQHCRAATPGYPNSTDPKRFLADNKLREGLDYLKKWAKTSDDVKDPVDILKERTWYMRNVLNEFLDYSEETVQGSSQRVIGSLSVMTQCSSSVS